MSDFDPQGKLEADPGPYGHESNVFAFRPLLGFAVVLIVTLALVYFALGFFMRQFVADSKAGQAKKPALYSDDSGQFPKPNNQVLPKIDLATLRARERKILDTYGWVNREKNLARVPIDRALEIVAQQGLPQVKNILPKGAREVPK
jgi:hypothetical protein